MQDRPPAANPAFSGVTGEVAARHGISVRPPAPRSAKATGVSSALHSTVRGGAQRDRKCLNSRIRTLDRPR